jgi:Domain of Unknown Function (DUF1080)
MASASYTLISGHWGICPPALLTKLRKEDLMKPVLVATLVVVVVAGAGLAPGSGLADKPNEGAWTDLFNGKDLTGWVRRGGKAEYRAEDGQIIGTTVPNTANSFLCTTRDYANFILELEFKVQSPLNSGVQIRSQCFDQARTVELDGKTIKIPAGRVHGYQVEIDPSPRAWTGGIYDEGRRGWLYDLKNSEAARKAFKQGEWNKFHIECRGDSIKTWLNGVPAADLKDAVTPSGFIGLQVHAVKGKDTLEVRFRNLRIKELK